MTARRYEISLRMLKNISRMSAANESNTFQHHLTFTAKSAIYYVTTATVFSLVRITCYFHLWRSSI